MRRILVTNDDGIDSPGLHALARAMVPLGEVLVFAPSREYSGAGASIGHIGGGIAEVHPVCRPELAGIEANTFDGPPALATLLAIRGLFGPSPDLVVSGINPGWNVGLAVLFSGTIGAALTAQQLGVPGIAVSQPTGDTQRWDTAAAVVADLIDAVEAEPVAHNVNVPNLPLADLAGTRITTLSDRIPYQLARPRLEPAPDGGFTVHYERDGAFTAGPDSDTTAVLAGFVSITPLAPTW